MLAFMKLTPQTMPECVLKYFNIHPTQKPPHVPGPIERLPKEPLLQVSGYLTERDLCSFLHVNHYFSKLLAPELLAIALKVREGASWELSLPPWAVSRGNEPLVHFLFETGVDANINYFLTHKKPIHYAVGTDDYGQVLRLLLESGADIEALDQEGRAPLHSATKRNAITLLRKGANIEAKDNDGLTPLHLATSCLNNELQRTQLFLNEGANIEAKDVNGFT